MTGWRRRRRRQRRRGGRGGGRGHPRGARAGAPPHSDCAPRAGPPVHRPQRLWCVVHLITCSHTSRHFLHACYRLDLLYVLLRVIARYMHSLPPPARDVVTLRGGCCCLHHCVTPRCSKSLQLRRTPCHTCTCVGGPAKPILRCCGHAVSGARWCGHGRAGKSSVLRLLGGLWPLPNGRMALPASDTAAGPGRQACHPLPLQPHVRLYVRLVTLDTTVRPRSSVIFALARHPKSHWISSWTELVASSPGCSPISSSKSRCAR